MYCIAHVTPSRTITLVSDDPRPPRGTTLPVVALNIFNLKAKWINNHALNIQRGVKLYLSGKNVIVVIGLLRIIIVRAVVLK